MELQHVAAAVNLVVRCGSGIKQGRRWSAGTMDDRQKHEQRF
jgi:hypothetical protein